jgi:hypothetical protein
MDGDISVESQLGEGSCFTLRVTCRGSATPSRRPLAPRRAAGAEVGRDPRAGRRGQLGQPAGAEDPAAPAGRRSHLVDNGQAAVEAWESAQWDVILMDIQMPVMDGLTATARSAAASWRPAARARRSWR